MCIEMTNNAASARDSDRVDLGDYGLLVDFLGDSKVMTIYDLSAHIPLLGKYVTVLVLNNDVEYRSFRPTVSYRDAACLAHLP